MQALLSGASAPEPDKWKVEFTHEAEAWYMGLGDEDANRIAAVV